jgi:hypothetical protein
MVVSILAIRAHRKDVREGNRVFWGAFFRNREERRRLWLSGLKDFGRVFLVACVLDTVYQLMVLDSFYPGQLFFVAITCAVVPYFLVRGPLMHLVRMFFVRQGDSKEKPTKP